MKAQKILTLNISFKDCRAPQSTATVILPISLDFRRSVEEVELREVRVDHYEALFKTSFGLSVQRLETEHVYTQIKNRRRELINYK